MPVVQMPAREARTLDRSTRAGPPSIYDQQDANSARDNIGQHMKETRIITGKNK